MKLSEAWTALHCVLILPTEVRKQEETTVGLSCSFPILMLAGIITEQSGLVKSIETMARCMSTNERMHTQYS